MVNETGIFNSESGDRTYNAEDFTGFYADFFTNGIVADSTSYLQVAANSGLKLWVLKGKAYINGGFFKPRTSKEITLPDSDTTYPRYDIVVLRWDKIARDIYLDVISGDSNTNPKYPELTRNETTYELGLAAVYVAPNATSITQDKITDLRFNDDYCGVVTGVIDTISTKDLFAQYESEWDLLRAGIGQDQQAIIAAWSALNTTKTVNGVAPVNGNLTINLDKIPNGTTRAIPVIKTLLDVNSSTANAAFNLADSLNNYTYVIVAQENHDSYSAEGVYIELATKIPYGENIRISSGYSLIFSSASSVNLVATNRFIILGVKVV